MTIDYATLDARALGLATHLCTRDELERWAALPDVSSLARAMETAGRLAVPLPPATRAADIDQAQRRTVASFVAQLERWAGPRNPVLDAFHAEQDRRSLRALMRGVVEGAAAEARLAGLLPTPSLTLPVLEELARAHSPREIATRLFVLGDVHAQVLVALTAQLPVDLLEVELALARVLAERWRQAARRGDAALRERLLAGIDLANAQAALELAGPAHDFDALPLFIAGGQALDRKTFIAAATAKSRDAASAELARALPGTALVAWVRDASGNPASLEAAELSDRLSALQRRRRTDPLGSAPVQWFLARLAAQSVDIRRLCWGLALGVPAAALREGLVTP
ncbi:MAG TPA: V-type ATPase subunit [Caldimonas sp.]|nr:V-type ATPase subunit [Caldimonas sp.]